MYNKTKRVLTMAGLVMALSVAATATAQDIDLWGPDVDMDRDGIVGVTDVQQVINTALGVNASEIEEANRPVRRYTVASPRASLAPLPPCPAGVDCLRVIGAVYNFPQDDGRLVVRAGSVIAFGLDRTLEGVWYEDACGFLGTQLALEIREDGAADSTWVEIGRDGAAADRCGPCVGKARVEVRHQFRGVGEYLVRARIWTCAIPGPDDPTEPTDPSVRPAGSADAYDEVYVLVRVIPRQVQRDDVEWEVIPDPVMRQHGQAMPHELYDVDGELVPAP